MGIDNTAMRQTPTETVVSSDRSPVAKFTTENLSEHQRQQYLFKKLDFLIADIKKSDMPLEQKKEVAFKEVVTPVAPTIANRFAFVTKPGDVVVSPGNADVSSAG